MLHENGTYLHWRILVKSKVFLIISNDIHSNSREPEYFCKFYLHEVCIHARSACSVPLFNIRVLSQYDSFNYQQNFFNLSSFKFYGTWNYFILLLMPLLEGISWLLFHSSVYYDNLIRSYFIRDWNRLLFEIFYVLLCFEFISLIFSSTPEEAQSRWDLFHVRSPFIALATVDIKFRISKIYSYV